MKLNEKLKIDTSRVAILPYNPTDLKNKWLFKNSINTKLTNDDLRKIDETLEIVIATQPDREEKHIEYKKRADPTFDYKPEPFAIDINHYKRQYVAVLNEKGEKEVWVNLICDDMKIYIHQDWKIRILRSHGGGRCFFQFKINLTRNKYYDVWFNAEA